MKMKKIKHFFESNSKTKEFYYLILLLIIPCFLFCATLTGCTKVDVGPEGTGTGTGTDTEGQPYEITVTVQDPNIGIGEVIPVTAAVTDSEGNPVDAGFQIDFSITPSNLGIFTPNDYVSTSGSGNALIYLFTLALGSGVVTAQFAGTGAWGALSIDIVGDPNTVVDPNSIPVPAPITGTGVIGSIKLSIAADSIVADGTSYVYLSAQVIDNVGMAMPDNTIVTFSTTGGDIDPLSGGVQSTLNAFTTDGIAQTTLRSSTNVGTVTIIASCNGFNTDDTVEFIPGPSSTIIVEAFPETLLPDGESTSNIVVTVYDKDNNPVADNTVLTFSANYGELNTLLETTSKGVATVTYTSPDYSPPGGTDTVTVEAPNEQTGNVVINLSGITGDPNAPTYPVGSITVSAGSQNILADGSTSVTITAEVKDSIGVSIPDGTIVTFTTTAGDFDPNTAGIQNMVTALTAGGIARIRLTSSTKTGTATITGEAGGFNSNTTVGFIPGPPATIDIKATPADLVADGISESIISVIVFDAFGNPVADGTILTFNTIDGDLSKLIETTSLGEAEITYTTPGYVPGSGNDIVTVETTNEISGSTIIKLTGAQVASITLSAEPESLPADGSSKATITAAVYIIGGGTAPDDTPVDFTIVSGGGTFQVTGTKTVTSYTAGGDATARLISDPNVGTATIQASSGGIIEEIQIAYTPGSVSLSITPNSLLGTGEEEATVVATLTDASGGPPPDGRTVTFTINDGTLGYFDPNSIFIDPVNGKAYGFSSDGEVRATFIASDKDGTVVITATWDTGSMEIAGSASAKVLPSPADIRIASGFPNPMSISIKGTGGISTSRITFDVTDSHSDPVPDGYRIDFTIQSGPNGGEIIGPPSALTENGQVTTLLRSGTKAGPVSIKAYYYYNSEVTTTTSSIAISAGPPVGEEFGISAQYINVSGLWLDGISDLVSIRAGDISGNPVPDDTAIAFKTYNTGGSTVPGSSETTDGVATSTLESSAPEPHEGFLSLTAEATNGGRTTHVTTIAVTPSPNNHIIYAGTDGGGIYKSTDRGYSWENISRSSTIPGQNWIDPYINDISIDPDNHNILYAATGYLGKGNIYRSINGGLNWNSNNSEEWDGIFSTDKSVLSVLCDDSGSPYVWIGTNGYGALYSQDGENFSWGGKVDPNYGILFYSGGSTYVNPNNNDKGFITIPKLSYTSKTEKWTAIYVKTSVYMDQNGPFYPTTVPGSDADGYLDDLEISSLAGTESWTITYMGGFDPNLSTTGKPDNNNHGTLYVMDTSPTTRQETWYITYRDPNLTFGWTEAGFEVRGTYSGLQSKYTDLSKPFTSENDEVKFYIIPNSNFTQGDCFTFQTFADSWNIKADYSDPNGGKYGYAKTDIPFVSSLISFKIYSGENNFYKKGDFFSLHSIADGKWVVTGEVSGTQYARAKNNQPYVSDNDEVAFTIYTGYNPFVPGDMFEFHIIASGLGAGKVVHDIVKVPGTNGSSATLFAGTDAGIYKSLDGGTLWSKTTSFPGDRIMTIEMQSDPPYVFYVGTEDAGVWGTNDDAVSWTSYSGGMSKGLSATEPFPNAGNIGNGSMSKVTVTANVLSETWTVTCTSALTDSGVFSVVGSQSGPQSDATVGIAYESDNQEIAFNIYDGTFDFKEGDTFTFDTIRAPGTNIKDLLIDNVNKKLYAVTYYMGALIPHAVGNVYVRTLDPISGLPIDAWQEVNQGLPQYEPPDDVTLFAMHSLAVDSDPAGPKAVYIGGEGINFLRSEAGLASAPTGFIWESSKSGMTNRIMARMPVLFSGECFMDVTANEIIGNMVAFTVYIQDEKGNPPIAGSVFRVILNESDEIFHIEYPDCYTYQGTFPDPSDKSTDNPFVILFNFIPGQTLDFEFIPTNSLPEPPGSSGSEQGIRYVYTDIFF